VYPLRRLGGGSGMWVGREVRSVWLEKIPFLVIGLADGAVALYFGIRNHLVEPVAALGWADRIAITVYGMAFYLRKTVVPAGLSPLYPLTRYKTLLSGTPFQLSAAIVLFVTLMCIVLRRRFPGLLSAWTACAVTLLPVCGLFQNGFQISADRYSYLACLGYALLAGAVISLGWRALDHSRIGRALLASAALLGLFTLSFVTRNQIAVWRDSDSLWTRAIAVEPSFVAHLNLGSSFSGEGDSLGAVQQFRQAIALWPESAEAHNNMGKALLDLHQWLESAQEFQQAVQLKPTPAAFNSLGHALAMQGKLDEAMAAFREALAIDPDDANAGKNLQVTLEIKARRERGEIGLLPREAR
jgi:protein O-mannosyl-transferase